MTKYIKFIGTHFADTLGLSDTTLNEKIKGKGGDDTLYGGFGNDKIKGGNGDDWIFGSGGDDDIDGGKGNDVAVYRGLFSEYTLSFAKNLNGTVHDTVAGRDGTDTLKNIEFLTFSDGIYDIANDTFQFFNHAPDVSGPVTGLATEDGAVSTLNALARASDVDGDTLSVVNVPASLPAGVSYSPATHAFTLDPSNAAFQHLAQGATATVTVNYGVSDGIATTAASVSWTITGANDAPVVSGAVLGTAIEDGAASTLNALVNASDVDDGAVLQVVNVPASLPAGVSYSPATHAFTLDPANAAFQHLAQGATATVTVNYGVSDGIATTAASVSWTITGANDAPVVSGAVLGTAIEDGAASTLNALVNASDVDDGAVLQVVNVPASLPAGVSYSPATHAFTLDPANAAFQHLALNQQTTVSVNYGVSDGIATTAASVSWIVTGVNDAATITGAATGSVVEAGGVNNAMPGTPSANGALTVYDVDHDQAAFQAVAAASLVGSYGNFSFDASSGQWTYTLDQAKADPLTSTDVRDDTLTVASLDGTAVQTIDVTIAGSNDAPVLQNVSGGNQSFDETAGLALLGTMAFTDVDLSDAHTVVSVEALGSGYIGDATANIALDSTGSGHGSVSLSYTLTPDQFMEFMAAGGTIPTEQDYRVTISDGHGGASTQVVQLPLADVLSKIIGPPATIVGGTTYAELTDTPGPYQLMATGTIEYTGPADALAEADMSRLIFSHTYHGGSSLVPGEPIRGTWSFSTVRNYDAATGTPGEIQWNYFVPESAARSLGSGEFETLTVPVRLDPGSATEDITVRLFGADDLPFLLPVDTWLFANSDLSPWLSMPRSQLQYSQTQQFTITAGENSHTRGGTISWVDPDALDRPSVSLTLETHLYPPDDPLVASLIAQVESGFHYSYETHNDLDVMDSRAAFGMIHWSFDISDSLLNALAGMPVPLLATFSIGGNGTPWSQIEIDLAGANVAPVIHGVGAIAYAVDVTAPGRIFGGFGFGDGNLFDSHSVEVVQHRPDGSVVDASGFFHASIGTDSSGAGTVNWFYDPQFYQLGNNESFDLVVRDNHGGSANYTVNFDYVSGGGGGIIGPAATFAVTDPPAVTEGNTGSPQPVNLRVSDYVSIYAQNPYIVEPYLGGTLTLQSAETFFARSGTSVGLDLGHYHDGTYEEGRLGQIVYDQQPQLFQINEDYGIVTYDKAAFDYLAAGDHVTATFNFLSREYPHGGGFEQAPEHITLTINGENDAPVVTGVSPMHVDSVSVTTGASTRSGTIGFTDVDLTDVHLPTQYVLTPTFVSIPWFVPLIPHLDTHLIADSSGGQTGSVGWQFTTDYGPLLSALNPTNSDDIGITPNLRQPVSYSFTVGVGDGLGGSASQTLTFIDKMLITGPGIASSMNPSGAVLGTGGDDIIVAVGNNNILANSAGNDMFFGAWATDPVVSYRGAPGAVSVHVATGTIDKTNGHDAFFNIDHFRGSALNDSYDAQGYVGFNRYDAVGGSDTIYGNWETQLSYSSVVGGVAIDLVNGMTSGGAGSGVGTDTFHFVSSVIGSSFNDTILGHAASTYGPDGQHAFSLTGGDGADTFVFNTATVTQIDTITDFTHGQDVLQVSAAAFFGLSAANVAVYNLASLAEVASLDPTHGAFVDIADDNGSTLYWAVNGSADPLVHLQHVSSLASSDFHLV